jgi:hypothetical protein
LPQPLAVEIRQTRFGGRDTISAVAIESDIRETLLTVGRR